MDLQNEAIELQKVFHQDYKTYWEETEAIKAHLEARFKALGLGAVMCRAGDFVKEVGGDWKKVLRVEGRNIYLDYDDGLNCLDVDDVIAWKHST